MIEHNIESEVNLPDGTTIWTPSATTKQSPIPETWSYTLNGK